jgi:hypothetical protein
LRKNSTRREEKEEEEFEPMIDYKYPTIASGATPIESAGRALDDELLQKERQRKFRVHGLNISLTSGARNQEPDDFGHCI